MNNAVKKVTEFSIWDSVVNDRIVQYEDLEMKYRNRCRKIDTLVEENERLKEQMEEASAKVDVACDQVNEKESQIQALTQEVKDLKEWIVNMENSFCWKITKPIRILSDMVKGKK